MYYVMWCSYEGELHEISFQNKADADAEKMWLEEKYGWADIETR